MSNADEGLDRIGDRLRPDHPVLPAGPPGLLRACSNFVVAAIIMCLTLCLSCTSCRPRLFRESAPVADGGAFVGNPAVGLGSGLTAIVPRSDHVTDASGNLLRSSAVGNGFQIEWSTPESPGATTEQVLDAVLSRLQNLNRLGLGGVDVAKHIYSVDKLLEEMRNGEFAGFEANLHYVGRKRPIGSEAPEPVGSNAPEAVGPNAPEGVVEEQTGPPSTGGSGFPAGPTPQ